MELEDEVREFLLECNENLAHLDQEIVRLEQEPADTDLIASVFRTFHTIKGTCGFFGFAHLGSLTHVAENILDQVRSGQRIFTSPLAALLLESVDAIRKLLATIETTGAEGADEYIDLRDRLTEALLSRDITASAWPRNGVAAGRSKTAKAALLQDPTIRVDVGLLDNLMDLVGELVLARNQLLQGGAGYDPALARTAQRLNTITRELQQGVLKTRMQPVAVLCNKLPRVVRDLAADCEKKIRIDMEGIDTELDKSILEAIRDPLTHIVRNACDHGIEKPTSRVAAGKPEEGLIVLRAFHEGGRVHIEVSDDGAGLSAETIKAKAVAKGIVSAEDASNMSEREAIHLVFAPGFSTAEHITSISGRGVGMDVVKTNINKVGGVVDIANRSDGAGSRVTIAIPLTLAIIPGLIVHAEVRDHAQGHHRFIIPQANLVEILRVDREQNSATCPAVEFVHGAPVFRRRGRLLPLTHLDRLLGFTAELLPANPAIHIVVLQSEGREFGLVVDGLSDTQEIVVKPLGKRMEGLDAFLGATILGDGHVALILDVQALAQRAGMDVATRTLRGLRVTPAPESDRRVPFLIFRAGTFGRIAAPLSEVARLEQIEARDIVSAAGRLVLHYRGQILPLIDLARILDPKAPMAMRAPEASAQIIVFGEGHAQVGVLVDCILDIIDALPGPLTASMRAGLAGAMLLDGVVTDMLDTAALQGLAAPSHTESFRGAADSRSIEPLMRIA